MTIYKVQCEIYIESNNPETADSLFVSIIRDMMVREQENADSEDNARVIDWQRSGTCYPQPATRAEIKAIEYLASNPDMKPAA